MPEVRVKRPFANDNHDDIVHPGDTITVDEDRARDLKANGLIEDIATGKAAPVPQNKAAPPPQNKAEPAPVPEFPVRRGPGRPPKVR